MSWIKVVEEKDAGNELKEIYREVKTKRGKLSNIMKVHSLNPEAMKAHMNLYLAIMFGKSGLKREECELIATIVSEMNGCEYCKNHHSEALNHYWKDQMRLQKLLQDFRSANLPERAIKMLEYVVKLTRTPSEVNPEDINLLRNSGFSDEDILNINLITSYFNFANRIASGLGVEFSPEEVRGYKY